MKKQMRKQDFSKDKRAYFSSLSEQELKNLLMTDFQSDDGEILTAEDIDLILEIIAEREKAAGTLTETDAEKKWECFVKNYLPLAKEGITLYDYPEDPSQPAHKEKRNFFAGRMLLRRSW